MSDEAQHPDSTPLDAAGQAELLELTQDTILVRDLSYRNRGAERVYGWSREKAHRQPTAILERADDRPPRLVILDITLPLLLQGGLEPR